jgi:hypothetical protein
MGTKYDSPEKNSDTDVVVRSPGDCSTGRINPFGEHVL